MEDKSPDFARVSHEGATRSDYGPPDPQDDLETYRGHLHRFVRDEVERDKKLEGPERDSLLYRLNLLQGNIDRLEDCCLDNELVRTLLDLIKNAIYIGVTCPDSYRKKLLVAAAIAARGEGSKRWRQNLADLALPIIRRHSSWSAENVLQEALKKRRKWPVSREYAQVHQ